MPSRPRQHTGRQPHYGTYIRAWPCECGKRGYQERSEAKKVIKEMRRQGKVRSDRVDAYRCQADPDYWHVGHTFQVGVNLNDPNAYGDDGPMPEVTP